MPTATQLRSDVSLLVGEAERELAALWGRIERPESAGEALRDILPGLIDLYGAAAATVAAEWYDELREETGIRGRFTAIPAELGDAGSQALVGWALDEAADIAGFRTLVEGGTQRRIANHARLTVAGSSIADPHARGWKRVGSGDSCDFCRLLLGRGAVYTESTAVFQAHDHDDCGAAPAWR